MSWNVFLTLVGRWLKASIPKLKGPFWKVVKFAVGVCKSELNLVLIKWISEFDSYKSLFLATKGKKYIVILTVEFLDSWIIDEESLFLAFIIILIILFWISIILELYAELSQKIMPHDRMEWIYEK